MSPPGSLQKDSSYKLQVQESVTVQEGLCVFVPCTVSYPEVGRKDSTPVHGYWFQKKNNSNKDILVATTNKAKNVSGKTKSRLHLLGDPRANDCSLIITDAQKGDSGKYYFQLKRGNQKYSYQSDLLTVDVTGMEWSPGTDTRHGWQCVLRDSRTWSVQNRGASFRGTHRVPSGVWPLSLIFSADTDA